MGGAGDSQDREVLRFYMSSEELYSLLPFQAQICPAFLEVATVPKNTLIVKTSLYLLLGVNTENPWTHSESFSK